MATTGGTVPTLVDIVAGLGPDGSLQDTAEVLNQTSVLSQDMEWIEANDKTSHLTTIRTSLPDAYFRRYNEGVLPSKSSKGQVTEVMAMLEAWSEIDRDLLNLNGNSAAWRASEEKPFKVSMGIKADQTILYGNHTTDPKSFTGLSTRFNDLNLGESVAAAKDGAVVDAGGSGSDNASIWLLGHGQSTFHGIYPKGSKAGLSVQDAGVEVTKDANGGNYWVARTHFKWDMGIAVRDWRAVIRIANIDVSNLVAESSNADLVKKMIIALERRPDDLVSMARWAFYAPRTVTTMLRIQALAKATNMITLENFAGRPVTTFDGVPVNKVDQLLTTEAALT